MTNNKRGAWVRTCISSPFQVSITSWTNQVHQDASFGPFYLWGHLGEDEACRDPMTHQMCREKIFGTSEKPLNTYNVLCFSTWNNIESLITFKIKLSSFDLLHYFEMQTISFTGKWKWHFFFVLKYWHSLCASPLFSCAHVSYVERS